MPEARQAPGHSIAIVELREALGPRSRRGAAHAQAPPSSPLFRPGFGGWAPRSLLFLTPPGRLQPSTPAVLPDDPDRVEVAAGTGGDAGAGIEFDRVMPGHGQRDRRAQTRVFLQIIALHAVDGCAPAGIVRAVHGHPYPASHRVANVAL